MPPKLKIVKPNLQIGDIVEVKPKYSRKLVNAQIKKVDEKTANVKFIDKEIIEKYGNNIITYKFQDIIQKKSNTKETKLVNKPVNKPVNKNKLPKNGPVEPLFWVLQNKKEFPEWINKTFLKYKISSNQNAVLPGKINKSTFEPFKYQKFIRDYLQEASPYRGILLYHGLGSGKTCTSITIAENLKQYKNIVVMLPASLRNNFIEDGLKFCGAKEYKSNPNSIKKKYTFVSYNASNALEQLQKIPSLDNHVIIVDEIHNLVSMAVSSLRGQSKQGFEIYKMIMGAKNLKIVGLSGTPIINTPFEVGILFNLLRGPIETHYFKVKTFYDQNSTGFDLTKFENECLENKYIDFLDVNTKNRTIEVHLTLQSWDQRTKDVIDFITKTADKNNLDVVYRDFQTNSLFPENEDEFNKYFIEAGDNNTFKLINAKVFKRRILGLVSFYASKKANLPEVLTNEIIKVEMSPYQYEQYQIIRSIERNLERSKISTSKKQTEKIKKVNSIMRIFSRQFCNFVFPPDIERPFVTALIKKKGKKINNTEKEKIEKIIDDEKKSRSLTKEMIDETLQKLTFGDAKYLKNNNDGLKKISPKMSKMIDVIDKSPGLCLIYSDFRTLEGIGIFEKVLEANGYSPFDDTVSTKPKFAVYSGQEKFEKRQEIISVFNSYDNRNGDKLKILLITRAGAEGLDLKNIRTVLLMEPYWNEVRANQVIGRAVRRNSHLDLPPADRNVSIFRFISVFTKFQAEQSKEKITTDEHILDIAEKKQNLIVEILGIMKEMAVDCKLNSQDNMPPNYECFSFGNQEGLAYLPNLSQDFVYSLSNVKVKNVNKEIIIAAITDKKTKKYYLVYNKLKKQPLVTKPKLVKKVGIDVNSKKVYDYKSVKDGDLIQIGTYNKNSIYKK